MSKDGMGSMIGGGMGMMGGDGMKMMKGKGKGGEKKMIVIIQE